MEHTPKSDTGPECSVYGSISHLRVLSSDMSHPCFACEGRGEKVSQTQAMKWALHNAA